MDKTQYRITVLAVFITLGIMCIFIAIPFTFTGERRYEGETRWLYGELSIITWICGYVFIALLMSKKLKNKTSMCGRIIKQLGVLWIMLVPHMISLVYFTKAYLQNHTDARLYWSAQAMGILLFAWCMTLYAVSGIIQTERSSKS